MKPARTIALFGIYLLILGAGVIFAPETLASLLFMAPPADAFYLIVGMLAVLLGYYYIRAAQEDCIGFFQATVIGRMAITAGAIVFMIMGEMPFNLLPVFLVDTLGAVWTMRALTAHGEAGLKVI